MFLEAEAEGAQEVTPPLAVTAGLTAALGMATHRWMVAQAAAITTKGPIALVAALGFMGQVQVGALINQAGGQHHLVWVLPRPTVTLTAFLAKTSTCFLVVVRAAHLINPQALVHFASYGVPAERFHQLT
ncbi:hypothetical protein [Pseudomonas sp. DP16D-R1]|uniref:hypothetical protein n=1 Tax=Pseudomonas sp. DP16D-R1 TaxID=2075551 RepID=UPI000CD32DA3|nr:hypothetical protein [Pseudomonas sp. DP16D-R1]POA77337.1 hypothetical protein C1890_15980 [Pseudomonas sp. DP16D-R1]